MALASAMLQGFAAWVKVPRATAEGEWSIITEGSIDMRP